MVHSPHPSLDGMMFNNVLEVREIADSDDPETLRCKASLVFGECDCSAPADQHTLYIKKRWHVFPIESIADVSSNDS